MDWNIAILAIALAWVLRVILTTCQINHYRNRINDLVKNKKRGFFGTGISSGRLYRSIVLLTTDDEGTIVDAGLMKGYTVFARVTSFKEVIGRNINIIDIKNISPEFDRNTSKALLDAATLIKKEMGKHKKDEINALQIGL